MSRVTRWRMIAFLSKWLLQALLALAVVQRLLPAAPSPGEGNPPHSVVSAMCSVRARKDRVQASFGPRAHWFLEVPSLSEACVCCACLSRCFPRSEGSWAMAYPLLGSPYPQQPLWEKSKVNGSWLCGFQKERLCIMLSALPLMRVIWILEGSLLWHQSWKEP